MPKIQMDPTDSKDVRRKEGRKEEHGEKTEEKEPWEDKRWMEGLGC
jgi:hypothetical protein